MNEADLMAFIKWLPTKIKEFQNKSPEEITEALNILSKTEEGQIQLRALVEEFKQSSETSLFKKGGKLNYLVEKFQKGGKQRQSDKSIKEFHGVDLFKYGPNSRQRINNTFDGTPIPSGSNSKTLPNGVGMRQISRKNITTTELVSPDKRDTLYIHNGIGGRVDSNIDDSGILGFFGLKKSSPVSDRYKFLQEIFKSHKF